jgi:hypothetical protein
MDEPTVYQTPQVSETDVSLPEIASEPIKSPFPKIFAIITTIMVAAFLGLLAYFVVPYLNLFQAQRSIAVIDTSRPAPAEVPQTPNFDATPSATSLVSPSPSSTAPLYFDFYDASVWLNPDLEWQQVLASKDALSNQAVSVNGPDIGFTVLPLQGREWIASYDTAESFTKYIIMIIFIN